MNVPKSIRLGMTLLALSSLAFLGAEVQAAEAVSLEKAAEKPARTENVTFDTIKLALEKDQPFERKLLTDSVKKIDGKSIRIRGYILPPFVQSGIKKFVLVRDNMKCCFGPGAALHDCIMVEMDEGKTIEFTDYPVMVEGVFHIKEVLGPDDKHMAIYRLEAKSVKQ